MERAVAGGGARLWPLPLRDKKVPPYPDYDDPEWRAKHDAHFDARRHNISAEFNRITSLVALGVFAAIGAVVFWEDIVDHTNAFIKGISEGMKQ